MGVKTWVIAAGALSRRWRLPWCGGRWRRVGEARRRRAGAGWGEARCQRKETQRKRASRAGGESRAAVEVGVAAGRCDPHHRALPRSRGTAGSWGAALPGRVEASHVRCGDGESRPDSAPGPPVAESNDRGEFVWSDASAVILGNRSHYSWLALRNGFAMKKISAEAASGETTALGDIVLDPGRSRRRRRRFHRQARARDGQIVAFERFSQRMCRSRRPIARAGVRCVRS